MCVQGVCVVWMSNFAKLSSSWLVQSIREVSRRVSESLVNILIVSPHKKNFLKMLLMYFLDKKRVKRKHFKGVKEARKEGALAGVDILALAPINIVEINKQFDETWKGIRKIRHF